MQSKDSFSLAILALIFLSPGAARADLTVGITVPGTNVYPNAAMYRVASVLSGNVTVSNAASLYAAACDATLPTHYGFFISSRNPCVMYKVRLDGSGGSPVFVSASSNLPVRCHNLTLDTRSVAATNHFSYGYDVDAQTHIVRIQLFPDPQNLDAAPQLVSTLTVPAVSGGDLAMNPAAGVIYYASGTNLVSLSLTDFTTTFAALLVNDNPTRVLYASNCVYVTTGGAELEKITLGLNGSLAGATVASNALTTALNTGATTDGNYYYGNTGTNQLVKIKTSTIGASSPTSWTISQPVDAQGYVMAYNTSVFDPDAGCVFTGTDEHDPGTVNKVSVGTGDVMPISRGLLNFIRGTWTNTPPTAANPVQPVNTAGHDARLGEVYIRSSIIDVQEGYAYFGHDNQPDPPLFQTRVTKVQISHKGSIKGCKVTLPVVATLKSLNFYSHMATPVTAFSSGTIRMAIYNDDGGKPGTLQWQSDSITNGGGWLSVTSSVGGGPLSMLTLRAGTYWLAWQVDSTLDVPSYSAGAAGSGFITWQPFGSFPANFQDPANTASNLFTSTPAGWDANIANQNSLGAAINHYGAELTSDNWSLYLTCDPAVPTPPNFTSGISQPNGIFNLQLTAGSNFPTSVLASTNLLNWVIIATNLAGSNGLFQFQDTNAGSYPMRFYRASEP